MDSTIILISPNVLIYLGEPTKSMKIKQQSKQSTFAIKTLTQPSKNISLSKLKPSKGSYIPMSSELSISTPPSTTATSSHNFVKAGIYKIGSTEEEPSTNLKPWPYSDNCCQVTCKSLMKSSFMEACNYLPCFSRTTPSKYQALAIAAKQPDLRSDDK